MARTRLAEILQNGGATETEALLIATTVHMSIDLIEKEMKNPMPGIAKEVYSNMLETAKALLEKEDDNAE